LQEITMCVCYAVLRKEQIHPPFYRISNSHVTLVCSAMDSRLLRNR
jgi:hypothetical protein